MALSDDGTRAGGDRALRIGAPIVVASGLYIWLRERQLSKSVVTELVGQD